MSKGDILYVKGMNMSDSDDFDENNGESPWEDRGLTGAYKKAVILANAEVAKRVAMATNSKNDTNEEKEKHKRKPKESTSKCEPSNKKQPQWKAGMPCRAVYEADGLEYEAFVLRLVNHEECIVKFLGYENSEVVPINALKPTAGNDERTRQIEQAFRERADDGFASESSNPVEFLETSDPMPHPHVIAETASQKKKASSKKKKRGGKHHFELPEMPMTMPNIAMLRKNLGSTEMPMPPPPMAFISGDASDAEDQAISSMLLSWYMSGYYTGLYQGLKRAKEGRRHV